MKKLLVDLEIPNHMWKDVVQATARPAEESLARAWEEWRYLLDAKLVHLVGYDDGLKLMQAEVKLRSQIATAWMYEY